VIKVINIAIGIVIVALVLVTGGLVYSYLKPGSEAGSKLDYDLEQWQAEVDAKPDSAVAHANLGATYMERGETDAGIRELKIAVDLAPEGYTYLFQLGLAYEQTGDAGGALDLYKRALELYPIGEKYPVSYQIANVYLQQGDLAAARDYIQQSLADNDGIWNAHYLLGEILEKSGDIAGARAQYQEAAKYNPTDLNLQQALVRTSA